MSYDWADAAYDEAMDSLYKSFSESALEDSEIYDRVVEDFREARLREFYIDHPDVCKAAEGALTEAKSLLKSHPRCSFILAATASEVCLRSALLTPILHGCFHSKPSADLIVRLIVASRIDGHIKALLQILDRHTGVDLRTFARSGSVKPLWEEMREVAEKRNRILHQAQNANSEEAAKAIEIAHCLLDNIFQRVIEKIGLHVHDNIVCDARDCSPSK